jgi:hypothetical protein
MRLLALLTVLALAGSPATGSTREVSSLACCCTGAAVCTCCGPATGSESGRTLAPCTCKDAPPRAMERVGMHAPALVVASPVVVCTPRPAAAEPAAAPREAPAPVPGFRPPLLL